MPIDFAKGIATQVVNTGLRKVAGNLPGLLGINKGNAKIDSSDTAPLNQKSQNSPNLYQFPLDVSGDPGIGNHGHYIIFFINEQAKAKLSFDDTNRDSAPDEEMEKEKRRRDIPDFINKNFGGKDGYQRQENVEGEDQLISKGPPDGKQLTQGFNLLDRTRKELRTKTEKEEGQYVRVKRPPTRRLDTAIAMYMPAQVQVTYGTKYNDTEISPLAGAVGEGITDLMSGAGLSDTFNKVVGDERLKSAVGKKVLTTIASTLDGVGLSGTREALEISSGEIFADRMELAFKGVDRRAFQYTFKMIPKNSREAEEIRKIVFAFKANMLPELTEGRERDTMTVPNTFNIQYMYRGKENDYVHRVSECFLENVQVTYGGDRYKTFEPHADDGAPPVETSITLAFKEIEIMTRERIFQGY